jgi:hypothetical protein
VKTLEKPRLPELQAKYAELVGEKTRSPNRSHILRRMTEARPGRGADHREGEADEARVPRHAWARSRGRSV